MPDDEASKAAARSALFMLTQYAAGLHQSAHAMVRIAHDAARAGNYETPVDASAALDAYRELAVQFVTDATASREAFDRALDTLRVPQ